MDLPAAGNGEEGIARIGETPLVASAVTKGDSTLDVAAPEEGRNRILASKSLGR